MATLEKRQNADGTYTIRVKVRKKGYPAQTASFSGRYAEREAKAWATKLEASIIEGRAGSSVAKQTTISDLIDRYIKEVCPQKSRGEKVANQLKWWKSAFAAFRVVSVKDVTPAVLVRCRDGLKGAETRLNKVRSGSTVNRYLAALSHLFTVAVKEWHVADENPVLKVMRCKEPPGRVRFLSDDERDRLFAAIAQSKQSARLRVVVLVALWTGMRRDEIRWLKWEDIDLERGRVVLHKTKNKRRRGIPLVDTIRRELERWKAEHQFPLAEQALTAGSAVSIEHPPGALVFPSPSDPKKPYDWTRGFELAVIRAGIEDFHFHDLRHSTASYLAQAGVPLQVIAEILGHRTLQMVLRYAHLTETETRAALEKMGERLK